jgi:hypothetical protein
MRHDSATKDAGPARSGNRATARSLGSGGKLAVADRQSDYLGAMGAGYDHVGGGGAGISWQPAAAQLALRDGTRISFAVAPAA